MSPETLLAALIAVNPGAGSAPTVVGVRDGLPVVLFVQPRPYLAAVAPAVVIVLEPAAEVPAELLARGEHLGGPSWRLPSADPVADAEDWSGRPGVRAADPDLVLPRRRAEFDDPQYGGQWYLERLGMEALYAVSLGDPATRVAVQDSGIEIHHPDLEAAVFAPYDAVDEDDDPSPNEGELCPRGETGLCDEHGTAVSGIVAARANNGVGIVGMCPACTLVPVKLLGEGLGALSADVRSFEHSIAQDVAVINNSWGYTESIPVPETLADVIHRAATEPRGGKGALVVFAAGNDDRTILDDEIEALPDVLCVSAVDAYGRGTAYTNSGATVDVSAPSATVTLSIDGGTTTTFGGTSAAAPVVSGLAAWASSIAPELSAAELMDLLVSTAVQSPLITPDENGHHDVFGYGIVDPAAILARLVPPPEPDAGPAADAGPDAASGEPDAGPEGGGVAGGGCSCRTGGSAPSAVGWVPLVFALWRRRRRS